MKQSIKLILLILFCVVVYAVYNLVTFAPDQKRVFTFAKPTLPAELLSEQEKEKNNTLTPSEMQRKNQAMQIVQSVISQYRDYESSMPQQASSTLSALNNYFLSGALPALFLGSKDPRTGERQYGALTFSPANVVASEGSKTSISCSHIASGTEALIGNEKDNTIECDTLGKATGDGDRLILGGPGNDKITDTSGNRIVNGGSGDDVIALGPGRSIIVLEDGWGNDKVNVDCSASRVASTDVPASFPLPWVYKSTNFIVLSPRIDAEDIYWDGLVLKSKSSDDTMTVNENCFTIIPSPSTNGKEADTSIPLQN